MFWNKNNKRKKSLLDGLGPETRERIYSAHRIGFDKGLYTGGILGILLGVFGSLTVNQMTGGDSYFKKINETPLKLELADVNKDGVEDKIFRGYTLYQVQYGFNKNNGTVVYLTEPQLKKMIEDKHLQNEDIRLEKLLDSVNRQHEGIPTGR